MYCRVVPELGDDLRIVEVRGDRQSGGQGLRQLQAGHRRIVGFDYPILGQVGDRRFTQRHAALQSKNIHPSLLFSRKLITFAAACGFFRRFANR